MKQMIAVLAVFVIVAAAVFATPVFRYDIESGEMVKAWKPTPGQMRESNDRRLVLLPTAEEYTNGWASLSTARKQELIRAAERKRDAVENWDPKQRAIIALLRQYINELREAGGSPPLSSEKVEGDLENSYTNLPAKVNGGPR